MQTDEELIRLHLQGDKDAFPELVHRHLRAVYNLAYRSTGDVMEAENIAQETFARAYKALPRCGELGSFRPWLLTIAVNLCRNRARRASHEPLMVREGGEAGEDPLDQYPDPAPGPLAVVLQNEADAMLEKAIAALPLPYRQVIILRYMEGLSYEELAQTLGLPLNTVRTHLSRAKERLRQALGNLEAREGDGLPRGSAALGPLRGGAIASECGSTGSRAPRPLRGLPGEST